MKKFVVYLMVIVMAVSLGFAVFYLVKDDEVISISSASIYTDVNKDFSIDVNHENKKSYTKIDISSSNSDIVKYNEVQNSFSAISGGVARINFRTNNVKFRNLWCDVIVGDGSEESPFYISSVEQLSAIGMGEDLGNGVYAGAEPYTDYSSDKAYKLVSDIDVKDINEGYWVPLRDFSGTFDGNGFTISNINIDYDGYAESFETGLHSTTNVGLFQSITATGRVYDIKFVNYRASGRYTNFGTIAGINKGTIERIEVKDAYISVETTETFGGLVGKNITSESGSGIDYVRHVARIDRCSINLTLGKKTTFENDQFNEVVIGNTGVIGGLVGRNAGGTIVYSYAKGEVNFLSDATAAIIYGGLIGENSYIQLLGMGGIYPTEYQGANIKDCYSNIITHFESDLTNADSRIGGAIGVNIDFSNKDYEGKANNQIVQNYIIGVYYNVDNLNAEEEGISKSYNGIGQFKVNDTAITYTENKDVPIVVGLTKDEMLDISNYVSHNTTDISFDDNGVSQGITTIPVSWLVGTVWDIDSDINDALPHLNYQLVYIPNDFNSVGVPVVINGVYQYINSDVEYPVTIISGSNGRINIEVGEEYYLKVNPVGLVLNWQTNDGTVVTVDDSGKITGIREGSASVSVSTKTGLFTDYIDVYVSAVSYAITNVPAEIPLNVGDKYTISGIQVAPATTLTYSVTDPLIASVDSVTGEILALAEGQTTLIISAGNTKKYVTIKVLSNSSTTKVVDIELSQNAITHTFDGSAVSGDIIIESAKCDGVEIKDALSFAYSSQDTNIVSVDSDGKYQVSGTGTTVVMVSVTTPNYIGVAYVYFDITAGGQTSQAGISRKSYNMNVGDVITIDTYGDIASIVWVSSDNSVVVVNNKGQATAVAQGTATIYAQILKTDGTYTSGSCDITVVGNQPTPVVTLTPLSSKVFVGATVSLYATLNITGSLSWEITQSPADIATVQDVSNTQKNLVFDKGVAGTVTVKVSYGNASKTAVITAVAQNAYVREIRTVEQLKNIANFMDKEYILVADLDLSGVEWTSLGTPSKPFTGIFTASKKDGNTYFSISGINVSGATSGLFAYTKGATLNNITVMNSNITGSSYAGSIVGYANSTKFNNCSSYHNAINGNVAGGIAGRLYNNCSIYNCEVINTSITTPSTKLGYVGGVVGYMSTGNIIDGAVVMTGSKFISISSGSHGLVGGVVGYTQGEIKNCEVSARILANKEDTDYAGGIVGYSTGTITNCVVRASTIEGYYAGGIGGSLNTGKVMSIQFSTTNKGYRREDISSISNYTADVKSVAVKNSVKILGEEVGGLFGTINSGIVSNCYTMAYLDGYKATSYVSGFASLIKATGFNKKGGSGQAGIIEYCYSACTYSGSCFDYAITKSLVHDDYDNRTCGYVFNYVFDKDLAKGTDYVDGTGIFTDPIKAKKSTEEMKNKSTYLDKGFSSTYWKFEGSYPTLVSE